MIASRVKWEKFSLARVLYLGRVVMCDEIVKTHTVGFMLWKSFSENWKVSAIQ